MAAISQRDGIETLHLMALRARQRPRLALGVAWGVALVGMAVVPQTSERFESKALIYVDTQSVLRPLTAGLAYQPDIDQQVRMLARTVISKRNVDGLAAQPGMGLAAGATPAQREELAGRLQKGIRLTAGDTGLYTISYRDAVPEQARRVVERTLQLFADSSDADKRRDSQDASRFMDERLQAAGNELIDAEGRLEAFKQAHFAVSGAPRQDHFALIGSLRDDLDRLRLDVLAADRAAATYREALGSETAGLAAPGAPGGPDDMGAGLVPLGDSPLEQELARQLLSLAELQVRFTDRHPLVIRTGERVAELQARLAADAAAHPVPKGAAGARRTGSTSPVVQHLRVALADAGALGASLRSRIDLQQQRLDAAQAVATSAPLLEADWQRLTGEVESLRKGRDQLAARQGSAALGVQIDRAARLADFRVVEPPSLPSAPAFPGHAAMVAITVALSLVGGFLAPTLAARIRPTVDDPRALEALAGRPGFGLLPRAATGDGAVAFRTRQRHAAMTLGALLLVQSGWLAWAASMGTA